MNALKYTLLVVFFSFKSFFSASQNPAILCYFNHPVNTAISTGVNAVYLNGSFADTVAAYIDRAKYTVDIAQYNYTYSSTGRVSRIALAANNAKARGVVVRWIYNGSSANSGLSHLDTAIKTLGSPTTSAYGIMHHKFMAIDANSATASDAILLTGSYDWSTTQTNSDFNNIVIIKDQDVTKAYYGEFNKMWGGTGPAPDTANSTFGPFKTASGQHLFNVNGTPVELYFSPQDDADTHLKTAINTANFDLFFGIYTFTDNSIANVIKARHANGVDTRGIIDQFSQTYSPYPNLSTALGSNLILYTGNYTYHNKIMVIDGQHPASDPQVFTGSYNWSYSGASLNDENAIIIHDSTIANEYTQSLCQNFADLGGAACISSLPLQLIYFKGSLQQDNKPLLQWQVADPDDLQYFLIEKSNDGIQFNTLASVRYSAAANGLFKYADNSLDNYKNYYRLRCVNKDGKFLNSNIIQIAYTTQATISFYPNPVKDKLFVSLKNEHSGKQTLKITDITGKVLQQQVVNVVQGTTLANFNTSLLAPGSYLLLTGGDEPKAVKFIK